jgi:hypothetical protein
MKGTATPVSDEMDVMTEPTEAEGETEREWRALPATMVRESGGVAVVEANSIGALLRRWGSGVAVPWWNFNTPFTNVG